MTEETTPETTPAVPATEGAPATVTIPHELQPVQEFLNANGRSLAIALVAVAVIVGGTAFFRYQKAAKARLATERLAMARSVTDLEAVAAEFPRSVEAPIALMQAGKEYYNSGSYDTALAKYAELQAQYPEHELAAGADLGRIHCLEAMGRVDEAAAAFKEFAANHKDHYLVPQAVLGQARCLVQAGRLEEARVVCEDFIAANKENGYTMRVQDLLGTVKRKLEQGGAATPAPAPAPAAADAPAAAPAAEAAPAP